MNQHALPALARQHVAELRSRAPARRPGRERVTRPSLRERTGWTMVDLGLRLVAQPSQSITHRPRPAGS